jgi:hypothetical protein
MTVQEKEENCVHNGELSGLRLNMLRDISLSLIILDTLKTFLLPFVCV